MANIGPIPNSGSEPESQYSFTLISEPDKPGERHIHTDLFRRCHDKVAGKQGDKAAYAICTASIGKTRSFLKYGNTKCDKKGKCS